MLRSPPRHPVCAESRTIRRAWSPRSTAWGLLTVREGTAIITAGGKSEPVREADLIITGAESQLQIAPEGCTTFAAVWVHGTYFADLMRWALPDAVVDRLHAKDLLDNYRSLIRVVRLDHAGFQQVGDHLDQLVTLTMGCHAGPRFLRIQTVFSALLETLSPHLYRFLPELHQSPQRACHGRAPLRNEAHQVAELIRGDLARRWMLDELAARAHLSVPQLHRVFTQNYGITPLGYLTELRAQELARLLRDTDEPIEVLMRQVGWNSRGHGARFFREHTGVTPSEYRERVKTIRRYLRRTSAGGGVHRP